MGVVDRRRRERGKSLRERGNNDLELTRFMTSGGCGGGCCGCGGDAWRIGSVVESGGAYAGLLLFGWFG